MAAFIILALFILLVIRIRATLKIQLYGTQARITVTIGLFFWGNSHSLQVWLFPGTVLFIRQKRRKAHSVQTGGYRQKTTKKEKKVGLFVKRRNA